MTRVFSDYSHEFCDNRPNVVLSDHKSRCEYRGTNPLRKELVHYRIDGHVLPSSANKKCDHLLMNLPDQRAYFVEIKGSDLTQAAKQINQTINELSPQLKGYSLEARVVLTKVNSPDLRASDYLKLQKRMKALGGSLEKATSVYNEKL